MNIVIIGAGEVGHHLAEILSREDHRVTVIDADPGKARLMESLDVQVVVGDGTRAEVLTSCGASKADLAVIVSGDDNANMIASHLCRELGAKRVILRMGDTSRFAGFSHFYKHVLGYHVMLSTDDLAAREIVSTVREQNALQVQSFAEGRVQLRRLRIRHEGELTLRPLGQLSLPDGSKIVAVWRRERFFIPTGEEQLAVDDQIYVVGGDSELDHFERLVAPRARTRRSVVIMGGGGVGLQTAKGLERLPHVSLRIIEVSPETAKELADEISSQVMVLVGDATDLDLLLEERIGEADIFIATSDDDERNMVACQLARSLGVERTIALVNKGSYRQIYDLLGIDQAISPRILCANQILRFVRAGSPASIAIVGDGKAEVLELEARHRKKSMKIKALGLPKGAVVGAIVRGDEVLVPDLDTPVEAGDHVILLSLPEHIDQVEQVFRRIGDTESD